MRVWSEVTLSDQETNVNYRLDYVLRKDNEPPVIVEIMTASTSGGNKSKRTDMQSAFCDAVALRERLSVGARKLARC